MFLFLSYAQLNNYERALIAIYYNEEKKSINQIAKLLERNPATICRELKRNKNQRGRYDPSYAQALAEERLKSKTNRSKYSLELKEKIETKLVKTWSPQQISNWYKMKNQQIVSTKTIYRYIKQGMLGATKYLRRKGKSYKRASDVNRMSGGKSIHDRSEVIENRERIGDWEVDTMVGLKGTKTVILTLVDRKSRLLLARLCSDRKASTISNEIVKMLKKHTVHSITADNGKEFADFAYLEKKLNTSVYFADPYCSWQRGTNENTNGLLREFIPKGIDLATVSKADLRNYVKLINGRPRKVLGYRIPEFVHFTPD